MGIEFYYLTDLTGGAAGDLDNLADADIKHREMALTVTTTTAYMHIFDRASTAAESSPEVIKPDDATGAGRWIVQDLDIVGVGDYSYAHFYHQESQGVGGGSRTTGVWTPRPYNTTMENNISGCSLSAGNINIPSGRYDFRVIDVQFAGYGMRIKLYNETDTEDILIGPSLYAGPGGGVCRNRAIMFQGRFSIDATKTVSVQAITSYTYVNGLGHPANITDAKEIYGIFELWRIGES